MNEIVFRFWSDQKDNWFYVTLSNYPTYSNEIWEALSNGKVFYRSSNVKDINGKTIYEGDILIDRTINIPPMVKTKRNVYYTYTYYKVVVKYGQYLESDLYKDSNHKALGFYVEDEWGQQHSLLEYLNLTTPEIISDIHKEPKVWKSNEDKDIEDEEIGDEY